LTAVSVTLAALKSSDLGAAGNADAKIIEAQRLLRNTMEVVHNFARELRPSILDELGLLPALRSYLNGFAALTGLQVRLQSSNVAEQLGPERKIVLFRVAQESLTNVAKHAEASQVAVTLRKVRDTISMEVSDNGKSFQVGGERVHGKRLGLLGMQERVRLVDGKFSILARPAVGTKVRVVVPLEADGPGGGANKQTAGRSGGRLPASLTEHRQRYQRNVQSRS
jgi:signal transduction histidine kinase